MRNDFVHVYPTKEALIEAAAHRVTSVLASSLAKNPLAFIAVSGGSTPEPLYERLAAASDLDWRHLHVCFVDERNVGPEDSDSNYRMVNQAWLSHVPIPKQNIHRMRGELAASQAADEYEQELRRLPIPSANGLPRFHFMLLGMGPDGHTASLFPGTAGLAEKKRWVIGNHVAKMNTDRITLTYPVINNAASLMFLIAGADKADPLASVLSEESPLPAAGIEPTQGELVWMVDQAAAAKLPRES